MVWSTAGLADGTYTYELRTVPSGKRRDVLSGTVTVVDGSLIDPGTPEQFTKDQVIPDDLIVDGSACIGPECVDGEPFGNDTLRLKGENLRIRFMDTSTQLPFSTRDWEILINDSSSGGQDRFSIRDIDGSRIPFTIEGNAPEHSLYVDTFGRIGLGTSTPNPDVTVHVEDVDTPTLRLEQDGITAQTWDVAGDDTSFFVRDVTNGSTLPTTRLLGHSISSKAWLSSDSARPIGLGRITLSGWITSVLLSSTRLTAGMTRFSTTMATSVLAVSYSRRIRSITRPERI